MGYASRMIRLASILRVIPAATCAAAFMAACGGDETSAPAGGGPIPLESASEALSKARCAQRVRCGLAEDVATCVEYDVGGDLLQLVADVGFGTVTYDPAAARACADHLRGASCDLLESVAAAEEAACDGVFIGKAKVDESCYVDGECEGELFCDRAACAPDAVCCAGACTERVQPAALGEDCSMIACDPTTWCETQMDSTMVCAAEVGNGLECTSAAACMDGNRCDINPNTGTGKCYTLSKEGQPCNPDLASGSCVAVGDWCHPADKKCVLRGRVGEACTDVPCLDFAVCDGMTCQAKPRDGEACKEAMGIGCRSGLACENDLCPARPARIICN